MFSSEARDLGDLIPMCLSYSNNRNELRVFRGNFEVFGHNSPKTGLFIIGKHFHRRFEEELQVRLRRFSTMTEDLNSNIQELPFRNLRNDQIGILGTRSEQRIKNFLDHLFGIEWRSSFVNKAR